MNKKTSSPARRRPSHALLPLGALAAGFGLAPLAMAQTAPAAPPTETVLPVIRAKVTAEPTGKDGVQATTTSIGKGKQELRDIPQSVTVVTERLMDDRNLDTMKDALKQTAGITFLAAEGGEEDIRLRGFPLQASGDVFVDGMRDPAFYERDTFFLDRIEVLRGSASMLFGRGSTGGAVNMVTKVPRLLDEHQVDLSLGSHNYRRAVGDFNFKLGDGVAARVGAMYTKADSNGAGSSLDKVGVAGALRYGIGERHEFTLGASFLENKNGMNYGMPFIRPTPTSPVAETRLLPIDPDNYYGMASDQNYGKAEFVTLGHVWRMAPQMELNTRIRHGKYERDQRAGTVRFAGAAAQPGGQAVTLATFGPGTVLTRGFQPKIQDMETTFAQSDFSGKFNLGGMRHEVLAGVDFANEQKKVYAVRTVAQGGVNLVKPNTTVGTPYDGASIDEGSRTLRPSNQYESDAYGIYAQDLIEFMPQWKLLLGLRYDKLTGDYDTFAAPANAADPGTTISQSYRMKVSEPSKRVGVLFQPNERMSFHFSAATSFNTSGDAYSLSAANVDIPPEESINLELGAKMDSADGNFSYRVALFRSTKLHERNTDPLVNLVTLSGKRHVAGLEIDFSGRPMAGLEVYGSYMWMPVAIIDEAAPGAEGKGMRPSLTPQHSGTIWATYQLAPRWRVGGGLNARSGQTPLRNPGFHVPKFITGDLMAEYTVVRDKFIIKANVSNVSNKLYADSLYTNHYIPGAGRLVQVTGTYKF
jgi:catecholate siderophore receptor